jgi:hypothetical protein
VQDATWSGRSRSDHVLPGRREWAAALVYLRGDGLLPVNVGQLAGESTASATPVADAKASLAAAAVRSPSDLQRAVAVRNLAALQGRATAFESAIPPLLTQRLAEVQAEIEELDGRLSGGPGPSHAAIPSRRRAASAARLARLIGIETRRRLACERVRATLAPLLAGGLLASPDDGDAALVELLTGWLDDAERLVARIAEHDGRPGIRAADFSAELAELERLVSEPAWVLLETLESDGDRRQRLQQEAALDFGEQVSMWQRRLEEVRHQADEAVRVGASCREELDELAVYSTLYQQARRAMKDTVYAEAVVPLHRLTQGPLMPAPAINARRARTPQDLCTELISKSRRGRELMRHAELLLLRTKTGPDRSRYMVMIRNPLASGAQGISIQGSSTLVDGDRDYLRGLIDTVTAKSNAGASRRVRPVDPGAPAPAAEPLDSELRDVGDLLYRLVVPDNIQRLLESTQSSLTIATNDLELPWELIFGAGQHLALTRPVARMPLGRAQPRPGNPRPEGSTLRFLLVCSDPIGDLPQAEQEVTAIEEALRARKDGVEVCTLIGAKATGKALNDKLRSGQYDVVHYAGHAVFATDDPDMSGLLLHREELFHAEKIQRLVEGQPLVFLNACETGRTANEIGNGQTTYIGEPATGLAAAFLYGGALGCLGSLWPVYDQAASRFAIDFYHKLIDGALVGEAVRLAREAVHRDFPDQVTWAAYSLNGDPTFRLTKPHTRSEIAPDQPS